MPVGSAFSRVLPWQMGNELFGFCFRFASHPLLLIGLPLADGSNLELQCSSSLVSLSPLVITVLVGLFQNGSKFYGVCVQARAVSAASSSSTPDDLECTLRTGGNRLALAPG